MQSEKIKGIVKKALLILSQINSRIKSTDGSSEQIRRAIESYILGNKIALQLLGVSVLQNCLDSHLLKRAEYHLTQLIANMSDEWTPIKISQMPLNLAYARTIHTSQGATFDKVFVKLKSYHLSHSRLFYTAFSRMRYLSQFYIQGQFNDEIFSDNVPKELKRFFDYNLMRAGEILNSNFLLKFNIFQLLENKIDLIQSVQPFNLIFIILF